MTLILSIALGVVLAPFAFGLLLLALRVFLVLVLPLTLMLGVVAALLAVLSRVP